MTAHISGTTGIDLVNPSAIPPSGLLNVQTFLASGTYTPTAGTNKILVVAAGPGNPGLSGGNGGDAVNNGAGSFGVGGSGGAGGEVREYYSNSVSTQTVTIQSGTVAGNATSFGSLLVAKQETDLGVTNGTGGLNISKRPSGRNGINGSLYTGGTPSAGGAGGAAGNNAGTAGTAGGSGGGAGGTGAAGATNSGIGGGGGGGGGVGNDVFNGSPGGTGGAGAAGGSGWLVVYEYA